VKTGSVSSQSLAFIHCSKPELIEQLLRPKLAVPSHDRRWLGMHPAIVAAYMIALAAEISRRRGLAPSSDNATHLSGVSSCTVEDLARSLVADVNLAKRRAPGVGPPVSSRAGNRASSLCAERVAFVTLRAVLPQRLDGISAKRIIELRERHAGARHAFHGYVEDVRAQLASGAIDDPEALDEHIRLEYERRLKPELQDLSRGLRSLGVGTFLGTFGVAVTLPLGSLLGASPGAAALAGASLGVAALATPSTRQRARASQGLARVVPIRYRAAAAAHARGAAQRLAAALLAGRLNGRSPAWRARRARRARRAPRAPRDGLPRSRLGGRADKVLRLAIALITSPQGRKRRRVALLMDAIEDDYQAGIVRGAASASQHANIELLCLAGGVITDAAEDQRGQRNFLFDLIEPRSLDGVLVLGGSLGNLQGIPAFSEWMRRFSGLPMVSLGVELSTCHSLVVDGAPGMKDTLRHLIEVHNHRRIAFIRGPLTSFEAEERYVAYREVLQEFGITEDPRLVLQGSWLRESGAAAVAELFDTRGMAVDAVSAIVSANDYMALGAMDALRDRGINVPGDVAITGFDDVDVGKCAVPPLTTVQQPTDAMGREGVRLLLALMEGKTEPKLTRLPTTIVGRRSCGCAKASVLIHRRSPAKPGRPLEVAVLERRALIFAELSRSARGSLVGAGPRWEERLLSAIVSDLQGQNDGAFLQAVDQLMAGLQRAGAELAHAQPVLSTLRRALQDCATGDQEAAARIDDMLDSARELVGEWLVRGETLRRIEVVEFLRGLANVSGLLLSSPALSLRKNFEEGLRRLGIVALSLGLFTEPGKASAQCLCLAGFEPSGRARVETHFRSADFAPSGVFANERGALLVQPLVFDGEPMGLLSVVLGEQHGSVYEQMRETFAIALRGYRLAAQAR
jgi:DNA-binding LacI/PurR family transcriptional regulator